MKLALIRQRYNAFGGAERFLDQAVTTLAAAGGLELTLVCREWTGPSATADRKIIRCDPFYLGRTWRDRGFARAACDATRAGFDLVQSHERLACCDIYRAGDGVHAQWLENRARARGALSKWAARLGPWQRYTLEAERRLYSSPRLRAVICNSRMVAEELRRRFSLDEKKIRVIYNAVDSAHFHPGLRDAWRARIRETLGIPLNAFVHLMVGSGFERKGVPQLLAAMRATPEHMHLVLVGADRRLPRWRSRADGLIGRVHFPGPQRDIAGWYAAADCFVLPTLYDPFPNAALEAMACGLPVITSRQCGAAELIEPARCGEVCDALDVAALAGYMAGMTAERAVQMGARARQLAEQFTPRGMAEQLAALYHELSPG